jgi:imidazolonepropionase-like amidohydrolase
MTRGALARLSPLAVAAAAALAAQVAGQDLLVRAPRIVLEPGAVLTGQALLIRDGRIAQVGAEIPPEAIAAARVVEFGEHTIVPGFVDPHTHLGLGDDLAERSSAVTPELRAGDAFDPFDEDLARKARAGITAAALAPLSANTFAGRAGVVRTGAIGALQPQDAYLKIALVAESLDQERFPTSLMGATDLIRRSFAAARAAGDDSDASAAALRDALAGGMRTMFHARTHAEITAALDLSEELAIAPILLGADEAARSLERLRALRASVVLAPLTPSSREPLLALPALLEAAGVPISFTTVPAMEIAAQRQAAQRPGRRGGRGRSEAPAENTPAPVPPIGRAQGLRVSAALAVRYGLSREGALGALTRVPAAQCGLAPARGTLRRGAHADFLVFAGDPLDLTSRLEAVYIGGERFEPRAQEEEGKR